MSKVHQVVETALGVLPKSDQNYGYGTKVDCYVCGTTHNARHLVRIRDNGEDVGIFPLCRRCHDAEHGDATDSRVVKTYWGVTELETIDGGEATTEEIKAFVGKVGKAEH